jgi:hypothetical protein
MKSSTMKEYTVRYCYGNRWYESKVCTDSSESALIWATDVLRGSNPRIVKVDVEEGHGL